MEKMSRLDTALTYFTLLIFMGTLTPSSFQEGGVAGGDPAGKIGSVLQVLAAPLVLILIFRNRERFLKTLRSVSWPLVLTALVLLSTLWSMEPATTLRRGIVFSVGTFFAIHLASLDAERRDRLFGQAVVFSIVASFLVVLFLPSYGISGSTHTGEWRGVFDHKNTLARQMVFAFFLALYSQAFRNRLLAKFVAGAALLMLFLSHSGTGLSSFAIVLAFAAVLQVRSYFAARQMGSLFWIIVAPLFVAAAGIGLGFRSELFELLGKDDSLTGRTTIWAVVFDGISRKPIFGWGYGSFFLQRELRVAFGSAGMPNHAHDGFFDVILATGFVGLTIFLVGYGVAFWNAWQSYRDSSDASAKWPLIFLVLLVFVNLTESNLLRTGTFMWIPYVSLALWGVRAPRREIVYSPEWSEQPSTA